MSTAHTTTMATEPIGDGVLRDSAGSGIDLPDGWHRMEVPGLRHPVVIGPGGVFALFVRRHGAGTVRLYDRGLWVNDRRTDQLATSQQQAAMVSRCLTEACGRTIACIPVVVIDSAEFIVRSRPDDVHVLQHRLLARWLDRLPHQLSADDVDDIRRAGPTLAGPHPA